MVGTPCLVRGSDQSADVPSGRDAPGTRATAAGCRTWASCGTDGGGADGDRSSDVELPRRGPLDGGDATGPKSNEVELAGADLRGCSAAAPRSSDVEPPRGGSCRDGAVGPRSSDDDPRSSDDDPEAPADRRAAGDGVL